MTSEMTKVQLLNVLKERDTTIATLEEAASGAPTEVKNVSTHTTPLQVKIAEWLTIQNGREVTSDDVIFTDIGRRGVAYKLTLMTDVRFIPTKLEFSTELVAPSTHAHEHKLKAIHDTVASCSCGDTISAKQWAEETGSTLVLQNQ